MPDIMEGFKFSDEVGIRGATRPAVSRALAELEKLPDMEVLSTRQVAARSGITVDYFHGMTNDPELAGYRVKFSGKSLWGNKRTIVKLKERLSRVQG